MVLKNNSGKDIRLPWGPYEYYIPNGKTLENVPSSVIKAMRDRYTGIEVVEEAPIVPRETVEEPPVEPEVVAELKEDSVVEATIEVKKKPRQRKGSDTLNQIA